MQKRVIVIGLDGVPYPMLKEFSDSGIMPNTAKIIQDGFFTPMQSAIPEISCVAWSSIITGKNPAEHGIFGFIDLQPQSYKMRFPRFSDLKSPPFWKRSQEKSIIINVPSTYPVCQMNGVHISGFVSIDLEESVYPPLLIPKLRDLDYRLDVDAQKAHSDLGLFLQDLDQTLTARIKAIEYLWGYTDWQVFMPTFTGTDRLMHFLYEAYEEKNHKYHEEFLNHFRKIDESIGWILSKLTGNETVIMLSDHGFEKLEKDVYVNYLLAEEGFLISNSAEAKLDNISLGTKAFALDPGRIFLNHKGRYPAGSLDHEDIENCLKELERLFSSVEIEGRKVIKKIHRKEDIYAGPYIDNAADLILIAEKGFNLKGAMTSEQLAAKGPFTGKHNEHEAFLLVNNMDAATNLPGNISVIDAGKLIKSLINME